MAGTEGTGSIPPGGLAGCGAIAHLSLAVRAIEPDAHFFRVAFGFREVFREQGMTRQIAGMTGVPGMRCDLLQLQADPSGPVVELIAFAPPGGLAPADPVPTRPGAGHLALVVADLDRARAVCEGLGARVLGEVVDFAEGPALYLQTPGGGFLELEERRG